jgi:hypothetical protein
VAAMPDIRSKALAYIRNGKVRVSHASSAGVSRTPYDVLAYVDGHNSTYLVRFTANAWSCSCQRAECAHAAAVQLVTGHRSAAEKPEPVSAR